ncbi:acetyl-CoA acetyltransferase [Novosphingobium profundi]|uniref:acetyl-CoA acetyltransferase n=1 Tax=Novosphingobium profundi TaxID=1774954 RepID=UPI001CFC924E|nr:acetyl-CoA acetyltransferase [Novosphingobium profundi]
MANSVPGVDDRTPVLIGVGQSVDRIEAESYHAWSGVELAVEAARGAFIDAGLDPALASGLDVLATTRTFEDTLGLPAPFGKSSNYPRSVALRLGADPKRAVWEKAGGNTPQDLVGEFCAEIARGAADFVLLAGGEAISTVRQAQKAGAQLDFSEAPEGSVEDRGAGLEGWRDPLAARHGMASPTLAYALAENARRARRGESRADYAAAMGRIFAPFLPVARNNPYSAAAVDNVDATRLGEAHAHNRWIADPYTLHLVARDLVNQGAAVLLASRGRARALGVPEAAMVYLHGHARAVEKSLLARPDMGAAPSAIAACHTALAQAELSVDAVGAFDFYSCFPIAVANAATDGLGLSPEDARGLTLTGGLPYFGGPGNGYSLHAIAEAVAFARRDAGRFALVGANGGYLSKYSVGLYSTVPRGWTQPDSAPLQAALDADPGIAPLESYSGEAQVETYSVQHDRKGPAYALVVARTAQGERLIARSPTEARETAQDAHENDALGRTVTVTCEDGMNTFAFA